MTSSSPSPVYSGPSMEILLAGVDGKSRMPIIGHRGCGKNKITHSGVASDIKPSIMENTILSFNLASSYGAEFVEFDVQVTKDGHPIIFHDDFIITRDKGCDTFVQTRIHDLTLEEFLSIGYQKDTQKADKVLYRKTGDGSLAEWSVSFDDPLCTLKQAFEQVDPLVGFNIELKFDDYNPVSPTELKNTIDSVLKVVLEFAMDRRIYFSSFHPDAALLIRQEQSMYPVLFLTDAVPDRFLDFRRNSFGAAIDLCVIGNLQGVVSEVTAILKQPEAVQTIKAAGLTLLTYGELNNLPEVLRLQQTLGVDGIIVDHVAEMVMESLKISDPEEEPPVDLPDVLN